MIDTCFWLKCALQVSSSNMRFPHESHPPVDGTRSGSVTSSTNGISTPSAFALEYTSFAVGPLAIKRSPSNATHCPEYFSRFSSNHLSDFAERLACGCEAFLSRFGVPFSSSHRRILSWSGADSCSIDLMIWSKLRLILGCYHNTIEWLRKVSTFTVP